MTDIIFTGDPHLAIGVSIPAGRHAETFYDEQRAKLNFIKQYGIDNKVKYLGFPGDILNYKNPSLYTASSINSLMKELKSLNEQYTVFSISGNHDLKFSSRNMKSESVYNIFTQGSVLSDIHGKTIYINTSVSLSGIDYNANKEEFMAEVKLLNDSLNPEDVNILMIHEHLLPDGESIPFGHFYNYSAFAEFKNIKVIVSGHLHKGFETQEVSDYDVDEMTETYRQVFINPWSLCRLSRDNYALDASHTPELVHLSITDKGEISYKHVIIPHKTPEEAFVKDALVDESQQAIDISEFVSQLNNVESSESEVLSTEDKSEKVKEKIEYYLEEASNS